MIAFDKSQTAFPSEKHKRIWHCGVSILPEELVLSDKVKELMDGDLFESCRQLRLFMLHSFTEMYENAETYDFEPGQYRFLWFWLGKTNVVGMKKFGIGRVEDKKLCELSQMEKYCAGIFAKTGVVLNYVNDSPKNRTAEITNTLYPNMFRALNEMHNIIVAKKEASKNNRFYTCDFRLLCLEYKYDKADKGFAAAKPTPENVAEKIADEVSRKSVLDFAAFLRSSKLTPTWTASTKDGEHTWTVSFKNKVMFNIRLNGVTGKWWVNIRKHMLELYDKHITDTLLQQLLLESAKKPWCGKKQCPERRENVTLFGVTLDKVCWCVSAFHIKNPGGETLENLKKIILESKNILNTDTT